MATLVRVVIQSAPTMLGSTMTTAANSAAMTAPRTTVPRSMFSAERISGTWSPSGARVTLN